MFSEFSDKRWRNEDQKLVYRHRATLALLPDDAKSVLDVGCGDGLLLELIHRERPGIACAGADFAPAGLEKAKQKIPTADFRLVDFTKRTPYENSQFDAVIALDILEHLFNPEEILREIARLSSKYVIIGVPNFASLPARLQVLRGKVPENNTPRKGHVYWFTWSVLKKLLADAELRIVENRYNHQGMGNPLTRFIAGKVSALHPPLFALSFVVLTEKRDSGKETPL